MNLIQDPLVLALIVALAITVSLAFRMRSAAARSARTADAAREECARANRAVELRDEEARHLADRVLPGLLSQWRSGAQQAEGDVRPLHPSLVHTPTGQACQAVLGQVTGLMSEAEARAEGAAKAAVQATTRSLQDLGYELQAEVTAMITKFDDETLLQRLMPVDHLASQLTRRLQVVGVLTGMWPGRQHSNAPVLDVARAGVSRIRDYPRIRVAPSLPYYLDGRAVEPLALLLGELMDNAARHSAPSTQVEVTWHDFHNCLGIAIHDAGPGMTPEVQQRVERLLLDGENVRLTGLGNPAMFGLPGVAALCARYGFRVALDQQHSLAGGCRAMVLVPRTMLLEPPEEAPEPRHAASTSDTGPTGHRPTQRPGESPGYDLAADGLPQRRRGEHLPMVPRTPASQPPTAPVGNAMAAFSRGIGSTTNPHITPTPKETTS
ncbi:ATP-binding protein [Streptomyces parvus]|uniref:ATP-binding protein n=1 Tax=Streptomyces parvus TaxID=66428 RepID=UPI0033EF60AF